MRQQQKLALFGSLRTMTATAMLTAMSVVIGIFCKSFLNFGGGLFRVTFENLPVLIVGILFGPLAGALAGAATDIISYLLSPQVYPINLLVTLGATSIGLVAGLISRYIVKRPGYFRIVLSCAAAHVVGSMILKPIGLYAFYGWAILWRVPLYLLIMPAEILLICLMYRNKAVRSLFDDRGGKHHDVSASH